MTPANWIALGTLVVGILSGLAAASRIIYRIGGLVSRLEAIDDKVQQILDGTAAPCAVHAKTLEEHDRKIEAIFRKLDADPTRRSGDNMRPVAEGG